MSVTDALKWPFFDPEHRAFAASLWQWAEQCLVLLPGDDLDAACRARVSALGRAGFLKVVGPAEYGGLNARIDVRTLCLAREILAYHDGLADFAFAMQGLGSGAISLFGSTELKARYLPPVCEGRKIAGFAISEAEAGSDVAAMTTTAVPDGPHHVRLDGAKTWISNGGLADHYVVFARTGEDVGAQGISAFVVDAEAPGLTVSERLEVIAPHPLATLAFAGVRVPLTHRLGSAGEGFKIAMATLDVFRPTVGAAALGFARRALEETLGRAASRKLFGAPLAALQMTQAAIAESTTEVDAAALLVYRAAWTKDCVGSRITREAAIAKMFATEAAQRVIDRAVQVFGARGILKGEKVEELYRDIRALRIYEGATEVQKVIIAREALRSHAAKPALAAE
jgi:acyl-CoA dehydrogenase